MLKWDWLVPEDSYSIRESNGFRIFLAFSASVLPILIGCALWFASDGFPPVGIPLTVVGVLCVLWGFFEPQLRKLHYLYGLETREQQRAIEWYETLSAKEKKQLPDGWDKAVREVGMKRSGTGNRYGYHIAIAHEMQTDAEEVIRLYRLKNKAPEVEDYRIELYTKLMRERAEDLRNEIKDRKEIEAKIARMP